MKLQSKYPKANKVVGLACLMILSATSVQAVDVFWSLGTASYNTPTAWTNAAGAVVFPGGADNAILNNGGTVLINPGDPNWLVNDIRAGDGAGNTGFWEQDGPTVTLNSWFRLGIGGGTGSYLMKSGTLNVNGRFIVGENGTAVYWQTNTTANNTLASGGELWCGEAGGGNGTMHLGGNAILTVNNWFAIGRNNSIGEFNLSGNASVTKTGGGNITFAGIGAGTATLNQTGGAVTNETSQTWLAENGTGTWNMSGGMASLGLLRFGQAIGSSGTFNLNGGTLMVNQIEQGPGAGSFNFNGGTLVARAGGANFISGVAGFLQVGGAVIDSQGFNITIVSVLADGAGGSLTKKGSGTATLTGVNSYIGPTLVAAGKLIVDTGSQVTSGVVVSNGAGFGVFVSSANAQHSPTNVNLAGTANSLDFNLGAFGNPTAAPLNVTGTLNVGGATSVNIADANPQVGQFPLVKYVARTGAGGFVIGTLPAGVSAAIVTNGLNNSIDLNITSTAVIRWDGRVAGGVWDINTTTNWTDFVTLLPAKYTESAAVYFDDLALGPPAINLGVTVNPGSVTITNDILAYTLSGAGSISGATGLTKEGASSFTIANANSYTGPTVINGGTLSVSSLANGGVPSAIGSSSASAANLVFDGGTLSYTGPAVTTDRGYTINPGNSTLDAQSDMTFSGAISANVNGNFTKSGGGTLFVKRTGANTLSLGSGGGAYTIANGTVVMDGSAGAQVNSVTGEFWPGATASTGASLVLTNTTLNVSSWLSIARGTGSGTSSVALYNSTLRSGNGSIAFDNGIAGNQTGFLTLNGTSTYTNNGDGNFGESSGGMAVITLNDSSVFFNNNRLQLGWHEGAMGPATGTVTVANSARIVVNAWMSIGNEGGYGSVLLKDNGSLSCTDLNLCDVNTGTADLVARDNSVVNAVLTFVGKGPGSTGTFTITNNATVTSGNFILGGSNPNQTPTVVGSTGTATLSGGTLSVPLVRGQPANGSVTTFNFNGGKLVSRPPYSGPDLVFDLATANVLAGGAVIEINTTDVRAIPQPLLDGGGGGGLNKLGTGTLLLNGANTYTGNTVVTAGTLGGIGSIAGGVGVLSTGTITAGDAAGIGQLTIGGSLTIAGNVAVDVNTSVSPSNDVIAVTGTLTKTGAGTLTVANLGPPLQAGDKFSVFNKPVTGGASLTVSGGGASWQNNLAVDGSITVASLATPAPNFTPGSVASLPDGNKSVTGTGTVGSTYKLWASTNVALTPITTTWTLLNSGSITVSPFTINDLTATNFPRRFYIFSAP